MRALHDSLLQRRAALVERSTAQRTQLVGAAANVRSGLSTPLLVGAGVVATLLSSSPQLRTWLVRGWAAYVLARRLIDR